MPNQKVDLVQLATDVQSNQAAFLVNASDMWSISGKFGEVGVGFEVIGPFANAVRGFLGATEQKGNLIEQFLYQAGEAGNEMLDKTVIKIKVSTPPDLLSTDVRLIKARKAFGFADPDINYEVEINLRGLLSLDPSQIKASLSEVRPLAKLEFTEGTEAIVMAKTSISQNADKPGGAKTQIIAAVSTDKFDPAFDRKANAIAGIFANFLGKTTLAVSGNPLAALFADMGVRGGAFVFTKATTFKIGVGTEIGKASIDTNGEVQLKLASGDTYVFQSEGTDQARAVFNTLVQNTPLGQKALSADDLEGNQANEVIKLAIQAAQSGRAEDRKWATQVLMGNHSVDWSEQNAENPHIHAKKTEISPYAVHNLVFSVVGGARFYTDSSGYVQDKYNSNDPVIKVVGDRLVPTEGDVFNYADPAIDLLNKFKMVVLFAAQLDVEQDIALPDGLLVGDAEDAGKVLDWAIKRTRIWETETKTRFSGQLPSDFLLGTLVNEAGYSFNNFALKALNHAEGNFIYSKPELWRRLAGHDNGKGPENFDALSSDSLWNKNSLVQNPNSLDAWIDANEVASADFGVYTDIGGGYLQLADGSIVRYNETPEVDHFEVTLDEIKSQLAKAHTNAAISSDSFGLLITSILNPIIDTLDLGHTIASGGEVSAVLKGLGKTVSDIGALIANGNLSVWGAVLSDISSTLTDSGQRNALITSGSSLTSLASVINAVNNGSNLSKEAQLVALAVDSAGRILKAIGNDNTATLHLPGPNNTALESAYVASDLLRAISPGNQSLNNAASVITNSFSAWSNLAVANIEGIDETLKQSLQGSGAGAIALAAGNLLDAFIGGKAGDLINTAGQITNTSLQLINGNITPAAGYSQLATLALGAFGVKLPPQVQLAQSAALTALASNPVGWGVFAGGLILRLFQMGSFHKTTPLVSNIDADGDGVADDSAALRSKFRRGFFGNVSHKNDRIVYNVESLNPDFIDSVYFSVAWDHYGGRRKYISTIVRFNEINPGIDAGYFKDYKALHSDVNTFAAKYPELWSRIEHTLNQKDNAEGWKHFRGVEYSPSDPLVQDHIRGENHNIDVTVAGHKNNPNLYHYIDMNGDGNPDLLRVGLQNVLKKAQGDGMLEVTFLDANKNSLGYSYKVHTSEFDKAEKIGKYSQILLHLGQVRSDMPAGDLKGIYDKVVGYGYLDEVETVWNSQRQLNQILGLGGALSASQIDQLAALSAQLNPALETLKLNYDKYLQATTQVFGGTAGNDYIIGNAAGEQLYGHQGNDFIVGGYGNDGLHGGDGDDIASGQWGDDVIYGHDGNDELHGGEGNDTLIAGTGNDKLYGGSGNDHLDGQWGNDTLIGGDGDDKLVGHDGNDTLYGETGNDTLWGSGGDDILYGQSGNDVLWGESGNDVLYGHEGRDELYGASGDDELHGGSGNDLLNAGQGNDTLFGNDGNDDLHGAEGNDHLVGGTGDDNLYGGDGADILEGGIGQDTLLASDGDDILYGNDGHDHLDGGTGNDTLYGGNHGDKLVGHDGDDVLYGEDGNDTLYGSGGDDTLEGGAGEDILWGENDNDVLFGGGARDELYGGLGDDELHGGSGNDLLNAGEGQDTLIGNDGNDELHGAEGNDRLLGGTGADRLYGGEDADQLFGGSGNDLLEGGRGNDIIHSGTGDDRLVYNSGDGLDRWNLDGSGYKKADFNHLSADKLLFSGDVNGTVRIYVLDANGQKKLSELDGVEIQNFSHMQRMTLNGKTYYRAAFTKFIAEGNRFLAGQSKSPEDLTSPQRLVYSGLSAGNPNDVVMGTDSANTLNAGGGNDQVYGFAGNDTLNGESGNDQIFGGDGDDTIHGGWGNDRLEGGRGNDTIVGFNGTDTFVYRKGDGLDNWSFGGHDTNIAEFPDLSIDEVMFANDPQQGYVRMYVLDPAGESKLSQLQGVRFQYFHSKEAFFFNGQRYSPEQIDKLVESGNQFIQANGSDHNAITSPQSFALGTNGNDLLRGSSNIDSINAEGGNDQVYGFAGNDVLEGGNGDDQIFGGDGDDTINGGWGNDRLEGGRGDDTIVGFNGTDTFVYRKGDGLDIWNFGGYDADIAEFPDLNISEVMFANDPQNGYVRMYVLDPAGESKLSQLQGVRFQYFHSKEAFFFNGQRYSPEQIDKLVESGNQFIQANGSDHNTISSPQSFAIGTNSDQVLKGSSNIDSINAEGGNDQVHGYAGNDVLKGGNGDDQIFGGDGDDTINGGWGNDRLEGGRGNDTIVGFNGTDTFVYRKGDGLDNWSFGGHDTNIAEFPDLSIDEVMFARDPQQGYVRMYVLDPAGESKLSQLQGVRFQYFHSKEAFFFNGQRYSPEQIDKLVESGNQFIQANGSDHNAITSPQSFAIGTNSDQVLKGSSNIDSINAEGGNDQVYGYAGNDTLEGGTGDDQIFGGDGDDTIHGGWGNDRLEGGRGNDTIVGFNGTDTFVYRKGDGLDIWNFGGYDADIAEFPDLSIDEVMFANDPQQGYVRMYVLDPAGESKLSQLQGVRFQYFHSKEAFFFNGQRYSPEQIDQLVELGNTLIQSKGGNRDMITSPARIEVPEYISYHTDKAVTGNYQANEINVDGHESVRIRGMNGNDSIDSGDGNDVLIGGRGDDYIIGRGGNDTYVYNKGDGLDTWDLRFWGNSTVVLPDLDISQIMIAGDDLNIAQIYVLDPNGRQMLSELQGIKMWGIANIETLKVGDQSFSREQVLKMLNAGNSFVAQNGYIWNANKIPSPTSNQLPDYIRASSDAVINGDYKENNLTAEENTSTTILGRMSNDTITGSNKDDILIGGQGNDTVTGGNGNDTFVYYRGDGSDNWHLGEGDVLDFPDLNSNEVLFGYVNNRVTIYVLDSAGQAKVSQLPSIVLHNFAVIEGARFGDQSLTINQLKLLVDKGNDIIRSNGDDISQLNSPVRVDIPQYALDITSDYRFGNYQDNTLSASSNLDTTLSGRLGNDTLYGGNKNDLLLGGDGNDVLKGYLGDDTLYGGDGNDELRGYRDNDTLYGGAGDDYVSGGYGNDFLDGGEGNDTYLFSKGGGKDVISDNAGTDELHLADISEENILVTKQGNDLLLKFFDADTAGKVNELDGVTIKNSGIETLQVGDNRYSNADLQRLAQATASFLGSSGQQLGGSSVSDIASRLREDNAPKLVSPSL